MAEVPENEPASPPLAVRPLDYQNPMHRPAGEIKPRFLARFGEHTR